MECNHLTAAVVLSAAGMLLLPTFGLLLRLQPEFVIGLHASSSSAEFKCYIVGSLYAGVCLVCCLLSICETRGCYTNKSNKSRSEAKQGVRQFRLIFNKLEPTEFAMDGMDRRGATFSNSKQTLELPHEFRQNE
ncbi:hypothetical protein CCR75_008274 [Bremia lactucae]|uniref:Uncharacterized protein n=1 Tax=Bremia lactucae TaxID=4779 RepID=A0A976IF60_BRELC|nr:hypothetical protein CCR75_008274 [Bremia lactucae]